MSVIDPYTLHRPGNSHERMAMEVREVLLHIREQRSIQLFMLEKTLSISVQPQSENTKRKKTQDG